MNLRHAAALALVGWYLMVPPLSNPSAPLSKWNLYRSYDTARECEVAKAAKVLCANTVRSSLVPDRDACLDLDGIAEVNGEERRQLRGFENPSNVT